MEDIRMTPDASVLQPKEKRLSELSRFSDDLEGRSAADILEWAASHFGKGLTFATGFGAEGCVLIDLIGKHNIPIDKIETHFGLLKRTAKKNNTEIFRVTSGQIKVKNALTFLEKAVINIKRKLSVKNRLSCKYCDFYKTEHCP